MLIPRLQTKQTRGRVAEWLNAPVLKTGVGATPPGVRIPPRPPRPSSTEIIHISA